MKISTLTLIILTLIGISFNVVAFPPKAHCVKKEMSDKHKAEIRLRVHYKKTGATDNLGDHAYGLHDSTSPVIHSGDAPHEDPGSGKTYCYPVEDFNDNIYSVDRLYDFRIDVKHASDCKNWKLSDQFDDDSFTDLSNHFVGNSDVQNYNYQYEDSTQTYALRYYHFGVHTHCKLRNKIKPSS